MKVMVVDQVLLITTIDLIVDLQVQIHLIEDVDVVAVVVVVVVIHTK